MTVQTLTLTEFLEARITEDEVTALAAPAGRWHVDSDVKGIQISSRLPASHTGDGLRIYASRRVVSYDGLRAGGRRGWVYDPPTADRRPPSTLRVKTQPASSPNPRRSGRSFTCMAREPKTRSARSPPSTATITPTERSGYHDLRDSCDVHPARGLS